MPTATATPPDRMVRFSAGARGRDTGVFYDESVALGGTSVVLPEVVVPPGDWLNEITLIVEATANNVDASVTAHADGPWNVFSEVAFLDAAGNTVDSLSGYNAYLQNLLGGFKFQTNPADGPGYSAISTGSGGTAGSFSFVLRVPVLIIDRDNIGSYPNGASNAVTRVRLTAAPLATPYGVAPNGTGVTLRVRAIERGDVLPSTLTLAGNQFAAEPPGAGTFQQWSQISYDFTTGRRVIPHVRKGNVYRALLFVARATSGDARSDSLITDMAVRIDDVPVSRGPWTYLRRCTWERQLLSTIPAGVVMTDFAHEWDGKVGGELRDKWVITQPGSKVEFEVETSGGGRLEVITNEIVPVGGSGVLRV